MDNLARFKEPKHAGLACAVHFSLYVQASTLFSLTRPRPMPSTFFALANHKRRWILIPKFPEDRVMGYEYLTPTSEGLYPTLATLVQDLKRGLRTQASDLVKVTFEDPSFGIVSSGVGTHMVFQFPTGRFVQLNGDAWTSVTDLLEASTFPLPLTPDVLPTLNMVFTRAGATVKLVPVKVRAPKPPTVTLLDESQSA